jgi:hypothetical protein
MNATGIPGYDFGVAGAERSPVTLDDVALPEGDAAVVRR